jgi:two-component system, chemotaxis family, chemotaxis protein CheY
VQPTVLIADDTRFMRFVLRELLDEIPLVRIAEAGNRDEAVHLAAALSPDLAVIDTTTEEFDGCGLIREITSSQSVPRVVAIVEVDDPAAERAAQASGAEAVIIKPYDPDVVLAVMEDMLTLCAPV